jgi:hypothetical protein
MLKPLFLVFILSAAGWAQSGTASADSNAASLQSDAEPPSAAQATTPVKSQDSLAQMRLDLDRMDSLLGNMSSEIEFLHDQNLQILLRTNSQMWTILIRDLRQQLAREEQRRGDVTSPPGNSQPPSPKAKPH